MNIFYLLITNNLPGTYVLVKNKNEYNNPFTGNKTVCYEYVFDIINYILQQNDIFYEKLKLLIKVTDSNSYFSNAFKSYFYHGEKRSTGYFPIEKMCDNILYTIVKFKDSDEKKSEKIKFLEENKITLGKKLENENILFFKFITLEELNEQVIKEADEILNERLIP